MPTIVVLQVRAQYQSYSYSSEIASPMVQLIVDIERYASLALVESWALSVERWALNPALNIKLAIESDHDAVWKIFHGVVAPGDTYALDPRISRDDAFAYWFRDDTQTYVAELEHRIVGTYTLRPNRSGGGAHVSNASFMVDPSVQGKGVGRAMAEHCLSEARKLGYRAMQFNFVVSTNQPALRLWQNLGFKIVGTLPGAFCHPEKGYVDAHVMFRHL